MRISRSLRAAFILLSIGFCVSVVFWFVDRPSNWRPVDVPISLVPGEIHTAEFEAGPGAGRECDVRIRFVEATLSPRSQCLAGLGWRDECKDTPSIIDISWTLTRDGAAVAHGSSTNPYLGHFLGQKRARYVLSLTVHRNASELNVANPHLVVSLSVRERKRVIFRAAVWFYIAGICLFGGLLCLFYHLGSLALARLRGKPPVP